MDNETLILDREARAADQKTMFGFWMYLMTDFVLFASLFAVFAVLRGNVGNNLFSMPFVLTETIVLLTSSFTCGIAILAAQTGSKRGVLLSLGATVLLGASFVALEISEFTKLISDGNGPQRNGFLSSYFTLVGTHGLHVTIGLLWIVALMIAISRRGLTRPNMRKLVFASLFWHFLDIVWIFIFTIVYLMGTL
jgi:cytochrome o ubiquinol oxidase subunit 3